MKKILSFFPESSFTLFGVGSVSLILGIAAFPAATEWAIFWPFGPALLFVSFCAWKKRAQQLKQGK
jgi:hypothetical protein